MNKAAKIIHIQVLYDPIFLFLLSNYLLVGLLGHRVNCLSQPITMAPCMNRIWWYRCFCSEQLSPPVSPGERTDGHIWWLAPKVCCLASTRDPESNSPGVPALLVQEPLSCPILLGRRNWSGGGTTIPPNKLLSLHPAGGGRSRRVRRYLATPSSS